MLYQVGLDFDSKAKRCLVGTNIMLATRCDKRHPTARVRILPLVGGREMARGPLAVGAVIK